MTSPWTSDDPWLRCALHAHTTNSDGELAPRALVKHYERAGYDVLAVTDHWFRSDPPSTDRVLVLPSAELNCLLPGRPRRARARIRDRRHARDARGRAARPRRALPPGSPRTAASPTSPTRTGPGVTPGTLELPETVSGIEVYNAGCELEIGRGISDGALGRAARGGDAAASRSPRTTATTRVRLRPRVDLGALPSRRASGVLEALRTRLLLRHDGPADHRRSRRATAPSRCECDPCRSVTVVFGDLERRGRARRAGSATATAARSSRRHRTGSITAARLDLPETARRTRASKSPTPAAARRGRTPYGHEPSSRDGARAELARAPYDLLVVGSGIVGAGIANEAARAGLRVALVDRGDFGGATSSASSKLIHGGLRYLRLGDVKLVREAHTERRALLRVVAPHLVRRIPFLFPVYRGGPYRPATIQAGLWTYSTLAGEKLGGLVRPERARRSVPPLRLDGLRGCGVYQDAWTHDGRLCLANVTAAAEAGATVLNFAEVVDLRTVGGRVRRRRGARPDLRGDRSRSTHAPSSTRRAPGSRRSDGSRSRASQPYGRLSKGVHVTLPLDEPWSAALTIPHDQVRVTFAYPWEGMLLLGTTDTLYEGDPAEVAATEDDVDRVLAEAAVAVDGELLQQERVLSTYAGLRVLPGSDGSTVDARRETAFLRGRGGMLTVAGGKLTTYRHIALDALQALLLRARARPHRPPARAASRRDRRRERRRAARDRLGARAGGRRPSRPLLRLPGRPGGRARGRPAGAAGAAPPRRAGHRRAGRLRRARRNGRRAPTTSSTGARRSAPAGSRGRTVTARVAERCSEPSRALIG